MDAKVQSWFLSLLAAHLLDIIPAAASITAHIAYQ